MKILHVEPLRYEPGLRAQLERAGHVEWRECADQAAFEAAMVEKPWDAVFVRLGLSVHAGLFRPTLRTIVTPTTGTDHIDVGAAESMGIRIVSLRGETAFLSRVRATAEHTWGLLLALLRRTAWAHADVMGGHWRREPFLGEELWDKTLGIVGLGRLGKMVAEYALAFGMRVVAHDTDENAFAHAPPRVEPASALQVMAQCDVLSLHLPLREDTRGWFGMRELSALRPGAFLVNTGRGELIDEAAVVHALRAGTLRGVATDVLSGDGRWDGHTGDSPLLAYAREGGEVLLTPHIGGYGRSSIRATREFIVQKFLSLKE